MSQTTPSADLPVENRPPSPDTPPSPGAQTVQAAPAAVKRSMPMALSILLGLLLAAAAGWLFYNLAWFMLLIYLAFVAATIIEAPVQWLKRHGIRRGLAALIVMVGGLVVLAGLLFFLANGVYNELNAVSSNLERAPQRINDTVNHFRRHFVGKSAASQNMHAPLPSAKPRPPVAATAPATGPATTTVAITTTAPADFDIRNTVANSLPSLETVWVNAKYGVEILTWMIIVFFIVLYMLIDGADHLKAMRTLLPKNSRLEATRLFNELSRAHRGWALASLANVCSASILIGSGLFFLGVPGAFVLGFVAGLGELIPNIGPVLGAVPALFLTLVADPDKFFFVLGMFVILQTIQSYTISPQMLKFSIRLPVLVTLLSVLVFATLFGFLGVLVAIPFVADTVVVWNYVAAWREKDTFDYDAVNAPVDGVRAPMAHDHAHRPRFLELFRRSRRAAPASTASTAPAPSLDRLEQAEQRAAPAKSPQP